LAYATARAAGVMRHAGGAPIGLPLARDPAGAARPVANAALMFPAESAVLILPSSF